MKDYKELSDNELVSEYKDICEELDECEFGSYSYDVLNMELQYIHSVLSERGL